VLGVGTSLEAVWFAARGTVFGWTARNLIDWSPPTRTCGSGGFGTRATENLRVLVDFFRKADENRCQSQSPARCGGHLAR